jgi:type I restriction enzyme S subunit
VIVGLKPYPRMKDSGAPWLGEVPAHWEIMRLGALLCERGETNENGRVTDVLSVTRDRGVIPYAEKGNVGNKKSDDIARYKIVRPDDIVVNSMNVIIGSVGLSRYTGCLSPVYYVLMRRSQLDEASYLNAYFQTKPFQLSLVRIGNGILAHRMRIPMELLKCEPFPRPPRDEQVGIVRFLEHADRRIRCYLRAKQKLIKLLEEQKQAVIHRVVTSGLDPNVRLRSSGSEWLGNVPEHWGILRAKLLLRQVVRPMPAGAEMVTCFRDGQVTLRRNRRTEGFTNAIKELGYQGIEPGQLVVHSMDAFAGAIGVSDSAGKCSPEYVICEAATDGVLLPYYAHLLRALALRGLFVVLCPSVRERAPRVRFSDFGSFVLPKPSTTEQLQIVEHIALATRELSSTHDRTVREIALLHEYRARLIADLVTGRLDVREAAATLPEEVTEPEALDEADSEIDTGEADEGLEAVAEEAEA